MMDIKVRGHVPADQCGAAAEILWRPPADVDGRCCIDSALLAGAGYTDLTRYGGGNDPILDIFIDK